MKRYIFGISLSLLMSTIVRCGEESTSEIAQQEVASEQQAEQTIKMGEGIRETLRERIFSGNFDRAQSDDFFKQCELLTYDMDNPSNFDAKLLYYAALRLGVNNKNRNRAAIDLRFDQENDAQQLMMQFPPTKARWSWDIANSIKTKAGYEYPLSITQPSFNADGIIGQVDKPFVHLQSYFTVFDKEFKRKDHIQELNKAVGKKAGDGGISRRIKVSPSTHCTINNYDYYGLVHCNTKINIDPAIKILKDFAQQQKKA